MLKHIDLQQFMLHLQNNRVLEHHNNRIKEQL
jgi:hypothetical protein